MRWAADVWTMRVGKGESLIDMIVFAEAVE